VSRNASWLDDDFLMFDEGVKEGVLMLIGCYWVIKSIKKLFEIE